ncbi:MAG: 1-acyl-sn-glycerol-3-phosphate acyltransferase [Acidimicrobiales bacterium]|nr:1-acyl-sn-glycerol-3-phosphate acyltransferase [Acidimicrobiales bacterium]
MSRQAGQLNTVARKVVGPLFRVLWRFEVDGLDRVPGRGPAILTPNHTSVIDSFFLPCVLPRRITYVGKAEYLDDWKTRYLFPALGMIPIDRTGGDAAEAALSAAESVLRRGELFGIYPEGTRSRNGKLHKGHTGPARLALRTGAPIVPVGLIGTREIQPPDTALPTPFRPVTVRFGQPIEVTRYRHRADDRRLLRQIMDEVMYEIRELTGQEYVDTYASKPASEPTPSTELAGETVVVPRRSSAEVLRAAGTECGHNELGPSPVGR